MNSEMSGLKPVTLSEIQASIDELKKTVRHQKAIQEALIDLLKLSGLITTDSFVIAFANVLEGWTNIQEREQALSRKLSDAGIQVTKLG